MIIICAYVPGMLRDETRDALAGEDVCYYKLHKENGNDYGNILAEAWGYAIDDLLIVEQDILPLPRDIQWMRDCPYPYCAAPYPWTTNIGPALGFTRFRREFMLKYPKVMDQANSRAAWNQLDVVLQRHILVREHGEQPHIHPEVTHLNEAKQLLPDGDPNIMQELPAW